MLVISLAIAVSRVMDVLKRAANSSLQQPVGSAAVLWLQNCNGLMLLRRVRAAGIWAFEKVDCRWYMIHTASTVPCLLPHQCPYKAKFNANRTEGGNRPDMKRVYVSTAPF
jgi:hypothetical protein